MSLQIQTLSHGLFELAYLCLCIYGVYLYLLSSFVYLFFSFLFFPFLSLLHSCARVCTRNSPCPGPKIGRLSLGASRSGPCLQPPGLAVALRQTVRVGVRCVPERSISKTTTSHLQILPGRWLRTPQYREHVLHDPFTMTRTRTSHNEHDLI